MVNDIIKSQVAIFVAYVIFSTNHHLTKAIRLVHLIKMAVLGTWK